MDTEGPDEKPNARFQFFCFPGEKRSSEEREGKEGGDVEGGKANQNREHQLSGKAGSVEGVHIVLECPVEDEDDKVQKMEFCGERRNFEICHQENVKEQKSPCDCFVCGVGNESE